MFRWQPRKNSTTGCSSSALGDVGTGFFAETRARGAKVSRQLEGTVAGAHGRADGTLARKVAAGGGPPRRVESGGGAPRVEENLAADAEPMREAGTIQGLAAFAEPKREAGIVQGLTAFAALLPVGVAVVRPAGESQARGHAPAGAARRGGAQGEPTRAKEACEARTRRGVATPETTGLVLATRDEADLSAMENR